MANATSTQLQELYVAYFGRAADPTGLEYWTELGITTSKFAADMYAQAEFKDSYGSLSTAAQVNQIYQNLFDREADVTGLNYWTLQINLGNLKVAEIATHLIWAAQNNSGSADDKTALTNKTNAAVAYTAKVKETTAGILAYAAENADQSSWVSGANIKEANSYLSGIDKDTVHTAAGIASSVSTITTNGVQADKKTFSLTTANDDFTGGSANDTFTADNSVATVDVSSTSDTLDGGSGTDTLTIFSDGTADPLPALTSIETLKIYDLDSNLTLAGTQQASLTSASFIRSDGIASWTVGANLASITLDDIAVSEVGISLTHDAEDTATTINTKAITSASSEDDDITLIGADLATVTINALTSTVTDEFDVSGAATINLNATGVFSTADLQTSSTVGALTVTGAGAVTLGTVDNGIDTITATAATGAQTFTAPANNSAFIANLGSGNDVVTTLDDGFTTAQTFNIDAGAGDADKLVVATSADANTADEAGRYDNFEILSLSSSQDVDLFTGITAIHLSAADTTSITDLNATQASNITFLADNTTSTVLSLFNESGESDSISITAASATTTTNVDLVGVDANFETVNYAATTGTDTTAGSALGFLQNTSDDIETLTITGSADVTLTVVDGTFDTQAVTIDASGLTGTGDLAIVMTDAVLYKGSTVTGSAGDDVIAGTSTLGSTYNLGAGSDAYTGSVADFVADGEEDMVVNAGAGTDTLTIDDAAVTVTDNHFTNVTAFEELTLSGENSAISITSGHAFETQAFSTGITITAATVASSANTTIAMGLYDQATTISLTLEGEGDSATKDDVTVTTGDGADTVTVSAAAFVGGAGAASLGGSINISTDGGADTISVTTGTITSQNTDEVITIDAGPGADTITLTTNEVAALTATSANIVVNAGDSLTTGRDDINGFGIADGTNTSMELQFSGIAVATNFTATVDYGTIKSHSLTTGLVTFDDAGTFATALVISSTNLADVNGYLTTNMDNLDTAMFLYDSTGNGTNDSTMVYNKHASGDSLVELGGVTAATVLLNGDIDNIIVNTIVIS